MKFTAAAFAFVASIALVNAQDLSQIPACAIPCFAAALQPSGCETSDTECQCTTGRQAISDSIATCLPGKCSQDEISKAISAGEALCKAAGFTSTGSPSATASGNSNSTPSATTPTGSPSASPQNTGAAAANVVGLGLVAAGMLAAIGL